MKILVDIGHPAHVHFFKNIIWKLEKNGHEVKITLRDKDNARYLLDVYGFEYEYLGEHFNGLLKKAIGLIKIDYNIYKIATKFKPDILIGESLYVSHVGKLIGKPSIVFCNNEHATLENLLFSYSADLIFTPECFEKQFNKQKHIRYKGIYFYAYLHPNFFKPNPSVLSMMDLNEDDRFIILRFVSWDASHDVGQKGFDYKIMLDYIKKLETYGLVFITSETPLPDMLKKYKITLPPEYIHDLLYFADIYIGEGGSMAAEAALLGTPSIFISTLELGYLNELEKKYNLAFSFSDTKQAMEKAIILLKNKNLKNQWRLKHEKMIDQQINLVEYLVNFIENYPKI